MNKCMPNPMDVRPIKPPMYRVEDDIEHDQLIITRDDKHGTMTEEQVNRMIGKHNK